MSKFKRKTEERLVRLEASMSILKRALADKDKEVERLERQNKDLMDRFMATKWETYVNQNPDRWDSGAKHEIVMSPLNDLSNAGEILSDEDIGK